MHLHIAMTYRPHSLAQEIDQRAYSPGELKAKTIVQMLAQNVLDHQNHAFHVVTCCYLTDGTPTLGNYVKAQSLVSLYYL